ncbi:uncharacterized protein LOC119675484 [Teleopsis dalmanni]|uniref:uncharacterized protein LOC119675484 n=1 Tax=Teleopsis dalmanni TaxID=139649 RepID=UPI0018CFCBF3|nr:uncharacterized protein LOC119675484 [Teleopsis dalmanni]
MNYYDSNLLLENAIDLSNSLAHVIYVAGIDLGKALACIDYISFAILNYDTICKKGYDTKIKLRKSDLMLEFTKKCLMTRDEARFTYKIVKIGFMAYYNNRSTLLDCIPGDLELDLWYKASEQIAKELWGYKDLTCDMYNYFTEQFQIVLFQFFERAKYRKSNADSIKSKSDEYCYENYIDLYEKLQADRAEQEELDELALCKINKKCELCAKERTKAERIMERREAPKCVVCHRLKQQCICPTWDNTIWDNPTFFDYYEDAIKQKKEEAARQTTNY